MIGDVAIVWDLAGADFGSSFFTWSFNVFFWVSMIASGTSHVA